MHTRSTSRELRLWRIKYRCQRAWSDSNLQWLEVNCSFFYTFAIWWLSLITLSMFYLLNKIKQQRASLRSNEKYHLPFFFFVGCKSKRHPYTKASWTPTQQNFKDQLYEIFRCSSNSLSSTTKIGSVDWTQKLIKPSSYVFN